MECSNIKEGKKTSFWFLEVTLSFGEDGGEVEDWRMGSGGDINTGEAEPSNSPPPSSTRSRLSLSSALLHGHTS